MGGLGGIARASAGRGAKQGNLIPLMAFPGWHPFRPVSVWVSKWVDRAIPKQAGFWRKCPGLPCLISHLSCRQAPFLHAGRASFHQQAPFLHVSHPRHAELACRCSAEDRLHAITARRPACCVRDRPHRSTGDVPTPLMRRPPAMYV